MKVSKRRRSFQPFAVPDKKPIDKMSMFDAIWSMLRKLINGILDIVAQSFDEVAYDEEASSVES